MNTTREDDLIRLVKEATRGPWEIHRQDSSCFYIAEPDSIYAVAETVSREDAALIVLAPELAREVIRLRDGLRRIAEHEHPLGHSTRDSYEHLKAKARAALLSASQDTCEHEWVDARNEAVESGELCVKCGAIRASQDAKETAGWANPDFDIEDYIDPVLDYRRGRASRGGDQ